MDHERRMARDEEFARWYRTHHDRIRALCAKILRDPIAAEDMAQETLLRAWQRRDQMREEDLGAWLSVVARNLCLSALRKDGRLIVTDELPERADAGADPAVEVGRRESRLHVRRAVARLGPRSRRVIDLREVREADYEEIGSELGVSAEGARAIAFRARKVMREHLAAVGEGFSGILVGIRVRVRGLRDRIRDSWGGLEAAAAPVLQAGLNGVLAISLVLTAGAIDSPVTRYGSVGADAVALASSAHRGSGSPAGSADASIAPAKAIPSKDVGGPVHQLTKKPTVKSSVWDEDQESEIAIKYGDFIIFRYRRGPTEDDGLEGARRQVDHVVNTLCRSEAACELLFGG